MLPQNFNLDSGYTHLQRISYIAGSSIISEILASPFERIKVKLQSKTAKVETPGLFHLNELKFFKNEILAKEGGRSFLYYGLKVLLDQAAMFNVARFYGYYFMMNKVCENPKHEFRDYDVALSCIGATSFASLIAQGSEVLRLKMHGEVIGDHVSQKVGYFAKLDQIAMSSGFGSRKVFLAGFPWYLVKQNCQALMEVFGFFYVRQNLNSILNIQSSLGINLASAFIASFVGTLVTAPIDLFHTRMVFRELSMKTTIPTAYILYTVKTEGFLGLYKSFLPYFYKNTVFNLSMVGLLQFFCDTSMKTESLFGEQPNKGTIAPDTFLEKKTHDLAERTEFDNSQEKKV